MFIELDSLSDFTARFEFQNRFSQKQDIVTYDFIALNQRTVTVVVVSYG